MTARGSPAGPAVRPAPVVRYGSPQSRWIIAATVIGSGMAAIDATAVGLALPRIGRQFQAPIADVQWVVAGYTLALSALLLLGGALGDRWGRGRVFQLGIAWFTLTSAACAAAPDVGALIVTRVLQGAGAALLVPASLAIIEASFAPDDRGRAIGAWSGLGGVATAAGPLLGGYLISAGSWRWIFLINVPTGVVLLAISVRHLPRQVPHRGGTLDLRGAAAMTVGLAALAYGLMQGPADGWRQPAVVAALALSLTAAAAFVLAERRSRAPLLPPALLRIRSLQVTNAVTFVLYAALGGVLFLLPVQLQVGDGYSALEAGAALLPVTVLMLALSPTSGRLAARLGPRPQMSLGPLAVGGGVLLLGRAATHASYVSGVLPGAVLLGLGLAATVAPLTATALSAAGEHEAGIASAMNNDVARVGGLVAVAILPALAGLSGSRYLHAGTMSHGFHRAVLFAATWCAASGLLALTGLRAGTSGRARRPPDRPGAAPFRCPLEATPLSAAAPAVDA